jgi:hypothetical protein
MITRINAARAANGLPPLSASVQLANAAARHSADLASSPWLIDTGQWHTGSDGSDIGERIRREGYNAIRFLEVTGWGFQGDSDAMFNWWMNSPVHRAAILSPAVDEAGVGYLYAPGAPWGSYWTVDFGRRGAGVPTPPPPEPPRPYTSHVPIVTAPGAVHLDLLPYLRGDGRSYRVGNSRGSFEVFQSQTEGDRFYQVKAWDDQSVVNWEGFRSDEEYIRRDVDTSPGGDRFYRQFDAPWVRRRMAIGQTFTQAKRVQFYRLENCVPIEQFSGDVIDSIQLVAHHREYTFPARDWPAVTLPDVVELEWVQGGETYLYARNYGLVGWARKHSDPNSPQWSAICEMRPDVGQMTRLGIGCLG